MPLSFIIVHATSSLFIRCTHQSLMYNIYIFQSLVFYISHLFIVYALNSYIIYALYSFFNHISHLSFYVIFYTSERLIQHHAFNDCIWNFLQSFCQKSLIKVLSKTFPFNTSAACQKFLFFNYFFIVTRPYVLFVTIQLSLDASLSISVSTLYDQVIILL